MFYQVVEEYTMQNRQHELAKDLKLRRQLRDSLESKSCNGLNSFAKIGDLMRDLVHVFKAGIIVSIGDETPRDCVVC